MIVGAVCCGMLLLLLCAVVLLQRCAPATWARLTQHGRRRTQKQLAVVAAVGVHCDTPPRAAGAAGAAGGAGVAGAAGVVGAVGAVGAAAADTGIGHARIGPLSDMHGSADPRVPPPDGMPPRQRLTTSWEGSGILRLGGRTL